MTVPPEHQAMSGRLGGPRPNAVPTPEEGKSTAGLLIEKLTNLAALKFAEKHLTH